MGYKYIGDSSFYKLTMQEIHRLQRGYAALHKEEVQHKPRESDYRKLALFKKLRGLQ